LAFGVRSVVDTKIDPTRNTTDVNDVCFVGANE